QEHFHDHPIDWLRALMAETKVPLPYTEPDLPLPQAVSAAIREQFACCARPWIVLGIGASHPDKDWPDAAWIRFLAGLHIPGTVFLIGGSANARRAAAFIAATGAERTINAFGLRLIEAAALLRLAELFVGPSSGPLNRAAAGGTDAFGLFGSTTVLTYSKFIHAVVAERGPSPDGMTRIVPAHVLERITPYPSRRKVQA